MPRLPRPAVLLAVALALTAALVLTACAGAQPATQPVAQPAVGTGPGSILAYEIESSGEPTSFVVVVRQNDADGVAFGFDLGDGARTCTVQMSAEAVESATILANTYGVLDSRLTDKTSVWLAREPFARLRAG